jgi:hypothetical protein
MHNNRRIGLPRQPSSLMQPRDPLPLWAESGATMIEFTSLLVGVLTHPASLPFQRTALVDAFPDWSLGHRQLRSAPA